MGFARQAVSTLIKRITSLSIYARIAIGNSIIIIIGAIAGTLLTHRLTALAASPVLILMFAAVGVTISVISNVFILRSALQPLYELKKMLDRLQNDQVAIRRQVLESDPDISQLARTLDSLITEIGERNSQLNLISQRAINAQEEERRRIAQSLHDDTGQALTTLIIDLERMENRLPEEQAELKIRLSSALSLARNTLKELRNIMLDLRPSILDDLGLIPAIRWYCRSNLESHGIAFHFRSAAEQVQLSDEKCVALFRIAQEAVNNIIRHSHASEVKVSLGTSKGSLVLEMQDNGGGFLMTGNTREAIDQQHWGLLGMQERAHLVGGEVIITSQPGNGTKINVVFPFDTR